MFKDLLARGGFWLSGRTMAVEAHTSYRAYSHATGGGALIDLNRDSDAADALFFKRECCDSKVDEIREVI